MNLQKEQDGLAGTWEVRCIAGCSPAAECLSSPREVYNTSLQWTNDPFQQKGIQWLCDWPRVWHQSSKVRVESYKTQGPWAPGKPGLPSKLQTSLATSDTLSPKSNSNVNIVSESVLFLSHACSCPAVSEKNSSFLSSELWDINTQQWLLIPKCPCSSWSILCVQRGHWETFCLLPGCQSLHHRGANLAQVFAFSRAIWLQAWPARASPWGEGRVEFHLQVRWFYGN